MTIGDVWRGLAKRFDSISASAGLDARILVGHVLGISDVELVCNEHEQILRSQILEIEALAVRRLSGEPVARIVGKKAFYGLEFALNEATLIPRPETEMLVDRAIAFLQEKDSPTFLELGVGTGCISIAILSEVADAQAIGVDISGDALAAARTNSEHNGVNARINWVSGSWFEAFSGTEKFDLIVANPPYIAHKIIAGLDHGVKNFDPMVALDGGVDGLDAYRAILSKAIDYLHPKGRLLLEIGFDQGDSVSTLCRLAGFLHVEVFKDLAGHPRVVEGKNRG